MKFKSYLGNDRGLIRFGTVLLGVGILCVGLVVVYAYRQSVDCSTGNPITWLFRNHALEAGEARAMQQALSSSGSSSGLFVATVQGHQVILNDQGYSRSPHTPIEIAQELRAMWHNVYRKYHPGAQDDVATTVYVDFESGNGFKILGTQRCESL